VGRADYVLTQRRFERIVQDNNPNIPGNMLEHARAKNIDLAPFIAAAFANGNDQTLIGMANVRDLPLSDAQLEMGWRSASALVRRAYCLRSSGYAHLCNFR
jgi:hypothetical protein